MSRFDAMAAQFVARGQEWVHGETVSYTATGGSATSIPATVDREPLQQLGPDGVLRGEYPIQIRVSRADVATVTPGADFVALKKRPNSASNTTFTVTAILDQDGGSWHLGLK